jgi:hypothetical protein
MPGEKSTASRESRVSRLSQELYSYALRHGFILGDDAAQYIVGRVIANIHRDALNDEQRDKAVQAAIRALPELERAITRRTANRVFMDPESVMELRNDGTDIPYPWNIC